MWMKFSMLPQPVGLLKLMLTFFFFFFCCAQYWREKTLLTWLQNIRLASFLKQDICVPICFTVSMMLNTTKLYNLIPVWMTLLFTQDQRVMGKLELVQSFWVKQLKYLWKPIVQGRWKLSPVRWIWIIWVFALFFLPFFFFCVPGHARSSVRWVRHPSDWAMSAA